MSEPIIIDIPEWTWVKVSSSVKKIDIIRIPTTVYYYKTYRLAGNPPPNNIVAGDIPSEAVVIFNESIKETIESFELIDVYIMCANKNTEKIETGKILVSNENVSYGDVHDLVDAGYMYFLSKTFDVVANDATVYMRHVSGAKHLHSSLVIQTVGQWEFKSYADTTFTNDGVELTPIKRRSDGTRPFLSTFYHTPIIDVLGTPRLEFTFGSGTNAARADSGQFSEDLESIFSPGTEVLIGLTNRSGADQYISFVFNVYEQLLS